MKHVFSVLMLMVVGALAMPSTADAGLVTIDNFSSATTASNAAVTRASSNSSAFFNGSGFLFTGAFSGGSVSYTMNAGTFGDFGTSFSMGVSAASGSEYTVSVRDQANTFVGNFFVDDSVSSLDFGGAVAASATKLTFAVSNQQAGGGLILGNGSFSAVPEPTSLALVGLAATGLAFRRRRRS